MAKETQFVEQIADINADFPQWYTDVVLKTKLVDYGPVKYPKGTERAVQNARCGERILPLADPYELFHERSGTRRGLCA